MSATALTTGEEYKDDGGSLDIREPDFDMDDIEESLEHMEEAQSGGTLSELHRMGQMGAKRIGSLAIGIGVVGIVLNQMSNLDIVANSTGVIDVSSIFQTAGAGLNLLVVGVIIAAAAVLLSLWSGF
jgi:hypothetical protein